MANVSYRPGQQVTDAADAQQWQQNRPADYQSSYQDKINSLLGQLLEREEIFSTATPATRFTASTSSCIPRTPTMPARDAAAQAAALTGGYGSSYATSAAQQAYQQQIGGLARHPHPVQSGAGYLPERRRGAGEPAGPAERAGSRMPRPCTTVSCRTTTPNCSRKARLTTTPMPAGLRPVSGAPETGWTPCTATTHRAGAGGNQPAPAGIQQRP